MAKKKTGASESVAELPFEQAFEQLTELVAALEAGDRSLEESLALFERGQALAARCSSLLEEAELKLRQLVEDDQGEFTAEDFEPEADG